MQDWTPYGHPTSDILVVVQSTGSQFTRFTNAGGYSGSRDRRAITPSLGRIKRIYVFTMMDRHTRCYLGWKVTWERTQQVMQEIVDEAPKAKRY